MKARIVVEIELAEGTSFLVLAELVESIPTLLLENAEVERAELVAVERLAPTSPK